MTSEPIVYVVDDDPAVRDALSATIRALNLDSACFGTAQEFRDAFDPLRVSCLVLDLRLPEMDGGELQQRLLEEGVQIPVIIITGHADVSACVRAMKRGAVDFLEKPYAPQRLIESIERALEIDRRRRREQSRQEEFDQRLAQLTPAERTMMEMLVAGCTNAEVAKALGVSLRTMHTRRASLFAKLDVQNRAQLSHKVIEFTHRPDSDQATTPSASPQEEP